LCCIGCCQFPFVPPLQCFSCALHLQEDENPLTRESFFFFFFRVDTPSSSGDLSATTGPYPLVGRASAPLSDGRSSTFSRRLSLWCRCPFSSHSVRDFGEFFPSSASSFCGPKYSSVHPPSGHDSFPGIRDFARVWSLSSRFILLEVLIAASRHGIFPFPAPPGALTALLLPGRLTDRCFFRCGLYQINFTFRRFLLFLLISTQAPSPFTPFRRPDSSFPTRPPFRGEENDGKLLITRKDQSVDDPRQVSVHDTI